MYFFNGEIRDIFFREKNSDEFHCNTLYEEKNDKTFHIKRNKNIPEETNTLFCKQCGENKFYVGKNGKYYTAIKCINCEWELCIHEG